MTSGQINLAVFAKTRTLIENTRINKDGTIDCGYWRVATDKAQQLVGGTLSFHRSWKGESVLAGTIISIFSKSIGGKIKWGFKFKPDKDLKINGENVRWQQALGYF